MAEATERGECAVLGVAAKLAPLSLGFRVYGRCAPCVLTIYYLRVLLEPKQFPITFVKTSYILIVYYTAKAYMILIASCIHTSQLMFQF